MDDHIRLHLDIERLSEQLGIDLNKYAGFYQYGEGMEKGNLLIREGKEDSVIPEAVNRPLDKQSFNS